MSIQVESRFRTQEENVARKLSETFGFDVHQAEQYLEDHLPKKLRELFPGPDTGNMDYWKTSKLISRLTGWKSMLDELGIPPELRSEAFWTMRKGILTGAIRVRTKSIPSEESSEPPTAFIEVRKFPKKNPIGKVHAPLSNIGFEHVPGTPRPEAKGLSVTLYQYRQPASGS